MAAARSLEKLLEIRPDFTADCVTSATRGSFLLLEPAGEYWPSLVLVDGWRTQLAAGR